jgi:iron(III) transport system substrate-binding protein
VGQKLTWLRRRGRITVPVAALLALSFAAAACGSSSGGSNAAATTAGVAAAATTAGQAPTSAAVGAATTAAAAADSAAWDAVIAAAKKEGKVTIYSSQGLDQLNDLGAKFKAKYGIDVEVVRGVDGDLASKVEAEQTTKGISDFYVNASESWVVDHAAQGWFVPPTGPDFDAADYNKATKLHDGGYFETTGAILTFGWNTQLYPKGLKGYADLLDPALAGGKIGVIKPSAPSIVDFYLYLQENFGNDFLQKLAAQKPRIYPSSLPMGQAVASGEIAAGSFVQALVDEKAKGAPVDFGIADKVWGARFWGMVLKSAPHPNAAQLLADFMITVEGQTAIARKGAAVLPNIPGTLTTTDSLRRQDLSKLTPDFVQKFQSDWDAMFAA